MFANLVGDVSYVVATMLLYYIFRPVDKRVSLIAALFSLAGCVMGALTLFGRVSSPVHILVFFGFYCLLISYLIIRSNFLPKILGVGMVIAGLGWLAFLSTPLGNSPFPYTMVSGIIGGGSFTVWLLAMGVNEQRWKEQAANLPAQTSGASS